MTQPKVSGDLFEKIGQPKISQNLVKLFIKNLKFSFPSCITPNMALQSPNSKAIF